jgi:hypothetical protein
LGTVLDAVLEEQLEAVLGREIALIPGRVIRVVRVLAIMNRDKCPTYIYDESEGGRCCWRSVERTGFDVTFICIENVGCSIIIISHFDYLFSTNY